MRPNDEPQEADAFRSFDKELIARGRLDGIKTDADRKRLWGLLMHVWGATTAYVYMEPFAKQKDGRKAFRAVYDHYMSASYRSMIVREAETLLRTLKYTTKSRMSLETFVAKHTGAHNDLEREGKPLSEDEKIMYFLDGIQAEYLDPIKQSILDCSLPAHLRTRDTFEKVTLAFLAYQVRTHGCLSRHGGEGMQRRAKRRRLSRC